MCTYTTHTHSRTYIKMHVAKEILLCPVGLVYLLFNFYCRKNGEEEHTTTVWR